MPTRRLMCAAQTHNLLSMFPLNLRRLKCRQHQSTKVHRPDHQGRTAPLGYKTGARTESVGGEHV